MGLQVYRKKRDFSVTPEPRGRKQAAAGGHFVIQKHAARRLHYDLRLELDGVMKSWAITRGPSLVPGEKRLAVHVEDHPIEYNTFEGTIPQGQYGGGTVMIWDRGRWTPEGDPHAGLKKGHLSFTLDGEKLKGGWHLVRMHKRPNERQDPWLLIKANDEAARSPSGTDILEERPLSVASGRSMPEIAQGRGGARVWQSNRNSNGKGNKPAAQAAAQVAPAVRVKEPVAPRAGVRRPRDKTAAKGRSKKSAKPNDGRAALPDFVPPQLAMLELQVPNDAGWVHEVKFDGYRIQARLDHGNVRLLTRKGLDWTQRFPNVAAAVADLAADTALLDGELVVEDAAVLSSFSGLQADLKAGRSDRFVYYVFDLLHLDGVDLAARPLTERKAALEQLLAPGRGGNGPLRLSEHFEEDGTTVLQQACRFHLEGVVSKRKDAPYRSGRNPDWVKTKCSDRQELVVVGYAASNVVPKAVGALIVGYYDGGHLRYAGRVGTGYSRAMAKDLWKRLHPLETDRPPIDPPPPQERRRNVVWVEPKTVIEADFRGWTADHLVRQAAFKGVREDKPAKEVVREAPAMAVRASTAKPTSRQPVARQRKAPAGKRAESAAADEVHLTHPDRVYWVDVGVTKQDLADYYRNVWDWMAPHVKGRPLALVRCPDGTGGECFFQKHASAGLSTNNLRTIIDTKRRQVIAIDDIEGLLSLVQAGVLEIHIRGALLDRLEVCDRIVFDLDPGEGVGWSDLVEAARDVRARLAGLELESFVKLSGGKGLHVVLPIEGAGWDSAKEFAQAVALAMAADQPARYLAKMTKSLREGKIFVDYFRNSLEQTSVAAYSTRARPGAPVSVPVTWQELGRTTGSNQYTVLNLTRRLNGLKQDPWIEMTRIRQKLPDPQALRKRG